MLVRMLEYTIAWLLAGAAPAAGAAIAAGDLSRLGPESLSASCLVGSRG